MLCFGMLQMEAIVHVPSIDVFYHRETIRRATYIGSTRRTTWTISQRIQHTVAVLYTYSGRAALQYQPRKQGCYLAMFGQMLRPSSGQNNRLARVLTTFIALYLIKRCQWKSRQRVPLEVAVALVWCCLLCLSRQPSSIHAAPSLHTC